MIYQNVPCALFEALKRSGCIMYTDRNRIESISLDRVLSVYGDKIIVYNYDKSLRLSCPATNMIMFRVQYIDQFYHVFTVPYPISEEFIEKVNKHDMKALVYGDDITCELVSMAIRALHMPPFCLSYPMPILFSSVSELPNPVIETMYDKAENNQDLGLISPYPDRDELHIEENVVSHIAPTEEMQTMFDPWALSDRGKEIVGITEENPALLERIMDDDEINIAGTKDDYKYFKESGSQIRLAGAPVKIGTNVYCPMLIKVVDEVEPECPADLSKCDLVAVNGNPIGYVIEPPAKPSKKK